MTSVNFPSIVVLNGNEAGAVLKVDEVLNNFVLGSDEGCHLVLSGASVSPLHATVFLDDDGNVTLCDTNSRGGVFVNGAQIMEQQLAEGDEFSLGPPDDPQSGLLRFTTQPAEAPLVDLSETGSGSGLEAFDPLPTALPADDALFTSELGRPDFAPEPAAFDPEPAAFAPEPAAFAPEPAAFAPEPAAFDPVPFEPLAETPAAIEEFPPVEMFAEAEPLPEPPPPPPAPKPSAAKPAAAKPAAAKSAPPARPSASPAPRAATGSDDPLAGLAESLGGTSGGRFVPPPAVAPPPAAARAKAGPSPAIMAARVAAVAVVLIIVAWFGMKKYSESIVIPVVDTYQPNPVEPGQTLTINGSGFGTDPDPTVVKVTIGEVEATVLDATATRINITVPESLAAAGSQTIPLNVTALGTTSTSRMLKVSVAPKISSLAPRVALSGDEVTIVGKWLSNPNTKPTVTVAGNEAEVLEAAPGRIRIRVPQVSASEGQRISVRAALGSDVGKEALLNYGRLPFIESVTPARALPGDIVTIAGLGLAAPDLAVNVSGRNAAVLSATDTEIKLSLPGLRMSDSAGARELTIQANQKRSVAHPIEVRRESAALYSPRFFAEVLEGSRAAVSCELGPVMVLGPDPASRRRAHDAALRLNTLAANARGARVQFIAGDVTISASGGSVLTVTPADGSGNPRALAPLWTAQLNDMFDLFFQGRRPTRTVELSPDGKVFVDIFAAARRRSAEPGVPMAVLSSPDPAWLRSFATLAASPSSGGGQALALLDGYWSGAIEAPGQPRKIEISLTATPSGLIGQRTSRQGKLSTDVSLQNLSYSRRELRFSFTEGGERLNFAGRLDGDVIAGDVTKASGARVGKLNFQLSR